MTNVELVEEYERYAEMSPSDMREIRRVGAELKRLRAALWSLPKAELEAAQAEVWSRPASPVDAGESYSVLDIAETAAMCELEGTPLAPVAAYTRAARECVECGSPVYGDHCTHCHEG
jgi:hypothetical protein